MDEAPWNVQSVRAMPGLLRLGPPGDSINLERVIGRDGFRPPGILSGRAGIMRLKIIEEQPRCPNKKRLVLF